MNKAVDSSLIGVKFGNNDIEITRVPSFIFAIYSIGDEISEL